MFAPHNPLARLSHGELMALVAERDARIEARDARIEELTRRVKWFENQLFGARTERRILQGAAGRQLFLGEAMLEVPEEPPAPGTTVKAYERTQRRKPTLLMETDSRLKFGPGVPVQVVEVPNPDLVGLDAEDYVVVDERHTYRLAQNPGSYVVLDYVQKVVRIEAETGSTCEPGPRGAIEAAQGGLDLVKPQADSGADAAAADTALAEAAQPAGQAGGGQTARLSCPPVPPAIFHRSYADVSFLVGLAVDKFRYHLPLHRQHQRLEQCGIYVDRATLTRLVHRVAELLEPIHFAVLSSVLQSSVLTVDETPTKAGRAKGKMLKGYFWGFYGSLDEVAFVFSPSRSGAVLRDVLKGYEGKLLSDGYEVYKSFAASTNGSVALHQCWSHTRRMFIEAEKVAPDKVNQVLAEIQGLYAVENRGRGRPDELLALRQRISKPTMERLFAFLEKELHETALLPSNPFVKAAAYAVQRKAELMACLSDPAVPLDTNHLEREFRPHAVGRKNWMFNVTEVGARATGIFYTLIRSCVLADVDPTTYLIDVLQRIETHPADEVHLLRPGLWKTNFAQAPLTSDLRG